MQLVMSGYKGDGVYDAKSGASNIDAFVRPTSSRAAYGAEDRSDMLLRVASGNPWL